jgi:hypothetical protein
MKLELTEEEVRDTFTALDLRANALYKLYEQEVKRCRGEVNNIAREYRLLAERVKKISKKIQVKWRAGE